MNSKAFRQGDRLQKFLTFVVEEALAGRGDQLKEYPIGIDVFGKDDHFDPTHGPDRPRVQARRLRMRLQTYYRLRRTAGQPRDRDAEGWLLPELPHHQPVSRVKRVMPPALISRNTVAVRHFEDCSPTGGTEKFLTHGLSSEILSQALKD